MKSQLKLKLFHKKNIIRIGITLLLLNDISQFIEGLIKGWNSVH